MVCSKSESSVVPEDHVVIVDGESAVQPEGTESENTIRAAIQPLLEQIASVRTDVRILKRVELRINTSANRG